MISRSRGLIGPSFAARFALDNAEGAGKAGRRLAPAVRCARVAHWKTAQRRTGQPGHPDLPCASGLTAYAVPSPEPNSLWPPSPCEKLTARAGWPHAAFRKAWLQQRQSGPHGFAVRSPRRSSHAAEAHEVRLNPPLALLPTLACRRAPASTAPHPRTGRLAIRPSCRMR